MASNLNAIVLEGDPYDPDTAETVLVMTAFDVTIPPFSSNSKNCKGKVVFALSPFHVETVVEPIQAGCHEYSVCLRVIGGQVVDHWDTVPKILIKNKVTDQNKLATMGQAKSVIVSGNRTIEKSRSAEAEYESSYDSANPVKYPDMVKWYPRCFQSEPVVDKHPFWVGNHEFGIEFKPDSDEFKVRMTAAAIDVRFYHTRHKTRLGKIQSLAFRVKYKNLRGRITIERPIL